MLSPLIPWSFNNMAVRHLSPVPDTELDAAPANSEVVSLARGPESVTERIRRLQWEARMLAAEQAEALGAELEAMAMRAQEIAEGGEAYPAGVRELAARIATDLPEKAKTLLTILHRNAAGS
jgi:intracellular sulfur oxidation DsrE/DsrF family protein